MYQTYEAIVEPTGTVHMLESLQLDHSCRAFVTLLEPARAANEQAEGNVKEILKFLADTRLSTTAKLTAQEIEAQILAEREAWN